MHACALVATLFSTVRVEVPPHAATRYARDDIWRPKSSSILLHARIAYSNCLSSSVVIFVTPVSDHLVIHAVCDKGQALTPDDSTSRRQEHKRRLSSALVYSSENIQAVKRFAAPASLVEELDKLGNCYAAAAHSSFTIGVPKLA